MEENTTTLPPADFIPSTLEEVLDLRTPEELEAAILAIEKEQAEQKIEQKAPLEVAEIAFRTYYPIFKRLVEHMPNKDARVLADYLVGWPLEISTPEVEFSDADSKKAFAIGLELINCKFIMMNAVQLAKMGQAMDAAELEKMENAPVLTAEDVQTSFEYEKKEKETNGEIQAS